MMARALPLDGEAGCIAAGSIEAAERPDPFLHDPTFVRDDPDWALTEKPGTRIGPYKLLQLIGEGGMGTVFEGLNERINRRVAIKVNTIREDLGKVGPVIAEQVEDQPALEAARAMGIDFVQGHAVGRPKPLAPAA